MAKAEEERSGSSRSRVTGRRSPESLGLRCFGTLLPSCSLRESRLLLTQLFRSPISSRKPSLLYSSLYIICFSFLCVYICMCVCCIHVSCDLDVVLVLFDRCCFSTFLHFVWLARKSIDFFFFIYKF